MSHRTLKALSGFRASQPVAGQLFNSGIQQRVLFTVEEYDLADEYDDGLCSFVPRHAGYYLFTASIYFPPVVGVYDQLLAIGYFGGNVIVQDWNSESIGFPETLDCESVAYVTPNDEVEVLARQNSVFNFNTVGGPGVTTFTAHRLT